MRALFWLGLLALASAAVGVACAPTQQCSFTSPDYSLHVATCDRRIGLECARDAAGHAVTDCPVLVECKAWAREVCK